MTYISIGYFSQLCDFLCISLTYLFWSLEADPAQRGPEAALRVAVEGEPLLQFAL